LHQINLKSNSFDHRKSKKKKGVMMKLMAMIEHPYHYEDVKRAYSLDAEMMIYFFFLCKHQEINKDRKKNLFVLLSTISLQLTDKIECHQRCGIT